MVDSIHYNKVKKLMKIQGPCLKQVYIFQNFISCPYLRKYLKFQKPNPFRWLGGITVLVLNRDCSQQGEQIPELQYNYLTGENRGTVSSSGHAQSLHHPKRLPVSLGRFLSFWLCLALVLTSVASSSSRTITLQLSTQWKSQSDAPWPALNRVSSPALWPLKPDKTRTLIPKVL